MKTEGRRIVAQWERREPTPEEREERQRAEGDCVIEKLNASAFETASVAQALEAVGAGDAITVLAPGRVYVEE